MMKLDLARLLYALGASTFMTLGLAGCGGGQKLESVASSWSFSPPPGWTMVEPSPGGATELPPGTTQWYSPDGKQRLLFGAFRRDDAKPKVLPAGVVAVGAVTLCGGRPASLLLLNNSKGAKIGDAVAMQWHNMRATATYFYPLSPDPQAEAALRSVCPKDDAPPS